MTTTNRPTWADKLDETERRTGTAAGRGEPAPAPSGDPDRGPTSQPGGEGRGWRPLSFLIGGPSYMSDLEWMEDVADGRPERNVRRWRNLVCGGEQTLHAGPARHFASGICWHLPELITALLLTMLGMGVWWPLLIAAGLLLLTVAAQVAWRKLSNAAIRGEALRRRDGARLASGFAIDDEPAGDADGAGEPAVAAADGGAAS